MTQKAFAPRSHCCTGRPSAESEPFASPVSEKSRLISSTVPATGIMYGNRNTDFSSLCRST